MAATTLHWLSEPTKEHLLHAPGRQREALAQRRAASALDVDKCLLLRDTLVRTAELEPLGAQGLPRGGPSCDEPLVHREDVVQGTCR